MTRPTDEEYAAAEQRYSEVSQAYYDANRKLIELAEEYQAAGWAHLRMHALRRDLDEMLIDALTRYQWTRPGATLKRLAEKTYRDQPTVRAALDQLVAAGKLRQVGKAWEVVR